MLSEEEKQEMLSDGQSEKRRKEFSVHKRVAAHHSESLDEYIQFLMSIQKVFPFDHSPRKTFINSNKL